MTKWISLMVTVLNLNIANGSQITAAESACLESAVNQAIASVDGDVHLVRDAKTGLVARIINLDNDENFDLAFLSVNDGIEFLSFESAENLFNLWAQPTGAGMCEVLEVRIDPIQD